MDYAFRQLFLIKQGKKTLTGITKDLLADEDSYEDVQL